MTDDSSRVHEALGRLSANVDNLTKAFESHKDDTTVQLRKIHDIVVAMSESARNLTRRIEDVEPIAKEFHEGQIEQRGIKRFLVAIYTAAGGVIVLLLGKLWDWYMARPHIPAIVIAVLALLAITTAAYPQEHKHPPADVPLHEKFYSTWYMPDQPTKSCCNKADCYPTEVQFKDGAIFAKRREDGRWLKIPANKLERNRDNPDGRNHLCAPMPSQAYPDDTVFCFALGTGG